MGVTYDRRVSRMLTRDRKLSPDQIKALEEQARTTSTTFNSVIIRSEIISADTLLNWIAINSEVPPIDLSKVSPAPELFQILTKAVAKKYVAFPVSKIQNLLVVAVLDPWDQACRQNLEIRTKHKIQQILATEDSIRRAIDEKYPAVDPTPATTTNATTTTTTNQPKHEEESPESIQAALTQVTRTNFSEIIDESLTGTADEETEQKGNENPEDHGVIRLANKIIIDAYQQGASDIHIEPYHGRDMTTIRFRTDGDCFVYQLIPNQIKRALISRLKLMAGLDIAERRLPQDGKIAFKKFYNKLNIELRVATIPTVGNNEDAVMRILASSKPIPIDNMGFSERNLREFKRIVGMPYGLILVVGPTGSGKTTTLHSGLGFINTPDIKIWTAEDPVEITQKGLRQVQVQSKIGYTFERAMRAFLRADPDVIMVGEMRDHETASMGIEASLTGHLVLSTLHTNSAPETIVRLIDMGLDPFNFGDALLGVLAQRLTKKLCGDCKQTYELPEQEYNELIEDYGRQYFKGPAYQAGLTIKKAVGCPKCSNTGYRSRLGIHELLLNSDRIKLLIQARAKVDELRIAAIEEGMETLKQDGIMKVFAGATDLKMVRAVCIK